MPRDAGPWVREKLRLLGLYLPGYLQATTRARDRIYIDGFAGPGWNRIRESGDLVAGSPLIALDAGGTDNQPPFTKLIFIEGDQATADEFAAAIEARGTDRTWEIVVGDVNEKLPTVVRMLPKQAPAFVFLGTQGIDPRWGTIEAISTWRTELLINFPLGMAINRNPDSAKVTEYFGTKEWRPWWERRRSAVVDFYRNRLMEIGYAEQPKDSRLINTQGEFGQHLYYLIPASKHAASRQIWDWILKQPAESGQGRLL